MIKIAIDGEKNTSGKMPFEGSTQPYPIFVATPKASDDLAYGLTKAVMENYEEIKDSGPSMSGYKLDRQNLKWVFPIHPGAIKYFKEKGMWGPDEAKHNEMMLKRQDVLGAAWKAYFSANKGKDGDAFVKDWQGARVAALKKAGMAAPFPTWE